MAIPIDEVARAERLQALLAGDSLPPNIAVLYSHFTRLRFGRAGLSSWSAQQHAARLGDAATLIDAGLLLRQANNPKYRPCLRRAGELLEWLAPPVAPNPDVPYRLLSAASYQIAGYPARANAVLKTPFKDGEYSEILRCLLRGKVAETFPLIAAYWGVSPRADGGDAYSSYQDLGRLITEDAVGSIALTAAYLRWGVDDRLGAAVEKLDAIRSLLVRETDSYSWLLARLTAAFAEDLAKTSLRSLLASWQAGMSADGRSSLERYLRVRFLGGRSQAWPSQQAGITRLNEPGSFALCTPTGSGKTSVAELAILQAIFSTRPVADQPEPIAVYLVPSRALAAEVEGNLTRVFRRLSEKRVLVTGLYGGTDWGPTDAWLTSPDPSVLICTYEKGEALMRFLGPHFLGRVSLVILDEAHSVRFNGNFEELRTANSRAFRLESLGMRLLQLLEKHRARIIALSAVAADIEQPLQSWVTNSDRSTPVTTDYRSTRQLIGRLLFTSSRNFEIRHDMLDRAPLQLGTSGGDAPFIPRPMPPCPAAPEWDTGGPEKRMRPPLLWAAMHLTSDASGAARGVLVSLTQQPLGVAKDFLKLLNETWASVALPTFFTPPTDARLIDLFQRCRLACADVFGSDSAEYMLLGKGIVLHHGKMPVVLGRLLVALVEEGVVNLVVATSTLSEGVNLPLETVLVPSLRRGQSDMSPTEFANLAGRAGRPNVSSEGQTLVLLPEDGKADRLAWDRYQTMIRALTGAPQPHGHAASPSALAELLNLIWSRWQVISGTSDRSAFNAWLETTSTVPPPATGTAGPDTSAFDGVDTLDSLLLSAVVEHEELPDSVSAEDHLQRLWRHSFAAQVGSSPDQMDIFLRRGRAIPTAIYPDRTRRRSLYSTGLPPRSATALLGLLPDLTSAASGGEAYAVWDKPQRLAYVTKIVEIVGRIDRFTYSPKAGRRAVPWGDVLAWWLDPVARPNDPGPDHRADWYKFADSNFRYLFSWGIGSFIGVTTAAARGAAQEAWQLDDWPVTGLPWAVFWLKELVTWGTLDPAAAYLVAKNLATTRAQAEGLAAGYYTSEFAAAVTDPLDPRAVRRWAESVFVPVDAARAVRPPRTVKVTTLEDFSAEERNRWPVLPWVSDKGVEWFDPAGYRLAQGGNSEEIQPLSVTDFDFVLNSQKNSVEVMPYL